MKYCIFKFQILIYSFHFFLIMNDNFKIKNVQELINKLNESNKPDAKCNKKIYVPILEKLIEKGIKEIEMVLTNIKYCMCIEEIIDCMNDTINKFNEKEKYGPFSYRYKANSYMINAFFDLFCINHPDEMIDIISDLLKVCLNKLGRNENENENENEENNIKKEIREKINLLTEQINTNNIEHENGSNSIILNEVLFNDISFENNNFNDDIFTENCFDFNNCISSENTLEITNEDSSENNSEITNEFSSENNSDINNEDDSVNNIDRNNEDKSENDFDFNNESYYDNNFDFTDFVSYFISYNN